MSDDFPYTVNDETRIVCPHCRETFEFSDDLTGVTEYDTNCPHCEYPLEFEIKHEIVVLAWKKGTRQ